jgi:hypothetical protein
MICSAHRIVLVGEMKVNKVAGSCGTEIKTGFRN